MVVWSIQGHLIEPKQSIDELSLRHELKWKEWIENGGQKDGKSTKEPWQKIYVKNRWVENGQNGGCDDKDECGSTTFTGIVAEMTVVIPITAEAVDYHINTRDSLTAQSVTTLSYCGISFPTIIWSAHYVSLSLLSSTQCYLFIPPWASDHSVTHRLSSALHHFFLKKYPRFCFPALWVNLSIRWWKYALLQTQKRKNRSKKDQDKT